MRCVAAIFLLFLSSCADAAPTGAPTAATAERPPVYGYKIVATYPHDPGAFTQGLLFLDGNLYESTGQIGRSTIRKVDLATGKVLQSTAIPPGLFGEGLVDWGDQLLSVTWTSGRGFRWDRKSFRQIGTFSYPGEGWGLTHDGRSIILSDGTTALRFLDPKTMKEQRRVTVTFAGRPLAKLNELEWVNGEVFANVWETPAIVRINPADGKVTGVIDLSSLPEAAAPADRDSVLNGIAYDAKSDRLFVTGKNWPRLYEIDLTAPKGP